MGGPIKDLSCPHCGKSIAEVVQHVVYGGPPPPPSGKPGKAYRPGTLLPPPIEDHEDDR